jgi:FKBP-type peptidyl-prolyl cis-trans isomerase/predicted Ser/Thr protein kinase
MKLQANTLLNHRYQILDSLGQGGFGITYLALDTELKKKVCIKELFVSGNSTRGQNMTVITQDLNEFSFNDFKERFIQEANQLARFNNPGIVRVIEFFEANNTAYLAMEYIPGKNLKDYIAENGPIKETEALPLINQLFDAVEEVHNAGMLHRDIKPDNILLGAKNRVVLIDFGSAREFTEGKTITQTAMLTPGFAPIEQYSNRAKRGTFTDVYALGATLYFLLTGHKPMAATDRYREQLAAPHQINPAVSEQLSSAVMMAMEMKEEDRFQDIGDFRAAMTMLSKGKQESPEKEFEKKLPDVNKKLNIKKILIISISIFLILSIVIILKIRETVSPDTVYIEKNSENELSIKSDSSDKFMYALGMMIGDNLSKNLGVTSKNFNVEGFCNSLTKGLANTNNEEVTTASIAFKNEAQKLSIEKKQNMPLTKFSEAFSKNAGSNFASSFKTAGISAESFKTEEFKKGFIAGLGEATPDIDLQTADQVLRQEFERVKVVVSQKNAEEGKKFLEENLKKNPKLKTTASGIQYEILKAGNGPKPVATDKVLTHYHGTHINGSVFDSSVDRGEPIEFALNQVIKGWTEILQLMPKGSKWKVYIPSNLAYGEQGSQGGIGPNEALVFEIELLKINGR